MTDIDLHQILSRASEGQDAPELVHRAVAAAHRRRARRRGGVMAVVAAAVVAALVMLPRFEGWSPRPVEAPASETPPSPTVVPDNDPATQPVWDPRSIEGAPLRPTKLPERIDLETVDASPLSAQPMSGIVAAARDDAGLLLLDTDGTWRTVPLRVSPGAAFGATDVQRPSISSDGTRVAVAIDAGIRVIDAVAGTERTVPWPETLAPPWDAPPTVQWRPGDDGFIVFDTARTSLVGLDGTSRAAPYRSYALAIDPDGPVYQNDFTTRTLLTFDGEQVVGESPFIQCERMVAGHGMVACTTGSLQSYRSGPVVVDPGTGEIIAYVPIKDRNAIYSDNGGLTLLGFLDESTLLMTVGPAAFDSSDPEETRHLVSWQFRTGEFQRISTGDSAVRSLAVAPKLVD